MSLHIIYGDICGSECDVIVNAANGIGFMGGILGWFVKFSGVSENINYITKGKVEREARLKCLKHYLIGYMPGSIYITKGYNLNCKYIFHAVTMWFPGTFSTINIIKKLLPQIVVEAKRMNLRSIALPLLGTGVGHLNPDKVMNLYEMNFKNNKDIDVYVYCGTKKCGSSVTCGENNNFSNIQGLQKPTLDNEFITADDMDNVTQDKTPLAHFICFYSMFIDGYTGDGKRAGGSHELIYNNDKRTVEEKYNFYGEGVEGGEKALWCITVPTHIKFEEDLIEYIKSKKPELEHCLKSYQRKRKPVNPPWMEQIASFPPLKK